MKKKVSLIAITNSEMNEIFEEIGICFIASYLRQNGYEVLLASYNEKKVDYEKIAKFNPDIIGFPIYSVNKDSVYKTVVKLNKMLPDVKMCFGGNLATFDGELLMNEMQIIDYIIKGEGELVFLDLLKCLEGEKEFDDVPGLIFRRYNEIISNEGMQLIENLDDVPFPARDILKENNKGIALLSTSRGCLSRCSYCSSQIFYKRFRCRSVQNVIKEIEMIKENYGISCFYFTDSSLEDSVNTSNRALSIAKAIIENNIEIGYFADFRAEVYKKFTDEDMKIMIKSGLFGTCIGIEANNEQDLKIYNKIAKVEDNHKIMQFLEKNNLFLNPGFINFNPYSTHESLESNIRYLGKYKLASNIYLVLSRLSIYKGTKIYKKVHKDKLIDEGNFEYKFLDDRIEKLFDYLEKYVNRNIEIFQSIHSYALEGMGFLYYMRRKYSISNDMHSYDNITKNIDSIKLLLTDLNNSITKWFIELLNLSKVGWDEEKSDTISNILVNNEYMNKLKDDMDKVWFSMTVSIIRKDPDARKMLLKMAD